MTFFGTITPNLRWVLIQSHNLDEKSGATSDFLASFRPGTGFEFSEKQDDTEFSYNISSLSSRLRSEVQSRLLSGFWAI